MNAAHNSSPIVGHISLHQLLLAYLRYAEAPYFPGADGLTIEVVLASYSQAAAARQVPDKQELVRRHPELTSELEVFFAVPKPSRTEPAATESGVGGTNLTV